jgi:hypothetical protein
MPNSPKRYQGVDWQSLANLGIIPSLGIRHFLRAAELMAPEQFKWFVAALDPLARRFGTRGISRLIARALGLPPSTVLEVLKIRSLDEVAAWVLDQAMRKKM